MSSFRMLCSWMLSPPALVQGTHHLYKWSSFRSLSSSSANFPVLVSSPTLKNDNIPDNFAVLLFGFAGSSFRQLEKHSLLYNSLGYRTLSCIVPHHFTFTFDMESIKECSDMMMETLAREGVERVVPVSFSNNGAILYQVMSQQVLSGQCPGVDIVGAVLDSAPGHPLGHLQKLSPFPEKTTLTASPPSKAALVTAHLGVNHANGVDMVSNLRMVADQVRDMKTNPGHSWPTHYLKYQDQSRWPQLYIYSEDDKLLPWQYIASVVDTCLTRGDRRTEQWRVQGAGHVAILKTYPDQYRDKVKTFLESL